MLISIYLYLFALQAFVRLSLVEQEIFYVATPTSENKYVFDLDVAEAATDFGQLSGTYDMVGVVVASGDLCITSSPLLLYYIWIVFNMTSLYS